MSHDVNGIVDAWRRAAEDLGIRVTAPFVLPDVGPEPQEFIALVHDFGSPLGALACMPKQWELVATAAAARGYFVSALYPGVYSRYDRQTFVDTLEDWGWYGSGAPPAWYTGVSPWA